MFLVLKRTNLTLKTSLKAASSWLSCSPQFSHNWICLVSLNQSFKKTFYSLPLLLTNTLVFTLCESFQSNICEPSSQILHQAEKLARLWTNSVTRKRKYQSTPQYYFSGKAGVYQVWRSKWVGAQLYASVGESIIDKHTSLQYRGSIPETNVVKLLQM